MVPRGEGQTRTSRRILRAKSFAPMRIHRPAKFNCRVEVQSSRVESSRIAGLIFPANSSTLPATTNTAVRDAVGCRLSDNDTMAAAAGGGDNEEAADFLNIFGFQHCTNSIPEENDDEAMAVSPVVESIASSLSLNLNERWTTDDGRCGGGGAMELKLERKQPVSTTTMTTATTPLRWR